MTARNLIVIAPDPSNTSVPNPGGQMTASMGLKQFADEHGIALTYIDTLQAGSPPPPVALRILKAARRLATFATHAIFRRPDGAIIFAAGPASYFERSIAGVIGRATGIPTLLCLRAGRVSRLLEADTLAGRAARLLLRRQHRVIVQGRNWLPSIENAGVNMARVLVVHNWISSDTKLADSPRTARPNSPLRFVFAGWLVPDKGVNELLKASRALISEGHDFRLAMLGGGALLNDLSDRVAQAGLCDIVRLTGWLDARQVHAELARADVFVLPTYHEGFPNALVEAMALGLPAISTPVGGIPDSLIDAHNGFLVPPRDAAALAGAMRRYIQTPELIATHSRNALSVARDNHDFQTNCRKLFDAFAG